MPLIDNETVMSWRKLEKNTSERHRRGFKEPVRDCIIQIVTQYQASYSRFPPRLGIAPTTFSFNLA
jgi:hypothetical protein